jgi:cytochrome b involved in lipid metabolism
MIKAGKKLVLLDDLVIDVSSFSHPGGEVVINRNIGRDVSKFFYGGYSMGKGFYAYTHSPNAELTARNLAKYRLVPTVYGIDELPRTFEAKLSSR